MSTVITTSATLDITLVNSEMGETIFKLNNPVDEVSLADIRNVYKNILGNSTDPSQAAAPANSHLFDRAGRPFVFVARAYVVETTTRRTNI